MTLFVFAGWLAGWIVLSGMRSCRRVANESSRVSDVSIIIPARNEEENLSRLLRSIASQPVQPREVIVVDDVSTDRTAEIAGSFGAHVVSGTDLPTGWRGKTWACHQGARTARGEVLLFLDADTWLETDGLSRIINAFAGGALAIAPFHVVRTVREQFSAFFNLVVLAGTGAFTIFSERLSPTGLLGQCLLIDRAAYDEVGGHSAVKDSILENFHLGEKLRALEIPTACRLGRGAVAVQMYPRGWQPMIDGWSKGFASGARRTAPVILLLIIAWIGAAMAAVFSGRLFFVSYAAFVMQVAILLRRVGSYRFFTALFYPLALLFFFGVFARSVLLSRGPRSVLWKGRPVRIA